MFGRNLLCSHSGYKSQYVTWQVSILQLHTEYFAQGSAFPAWNRKLLLWTRVCFRLSPLEAFLSPRAGQLLAPSLDTQRHLSTSPNLATEPPSNFQHLILKYKETISNHQMFVKSLPHERERPVWTNRSSFQKEKEKEEKVLGINENFKNF